MDLAIPGALVSGHEALIDGLVLPDPDDRHVLAAAIRCHASVILTFNERDFPADVLGSFGLEAQHPDLSSRTSSISTRPRWSPLHSGSDSS
jgi:hypothetical protein